MTAIFFLQIKGTKPRHSNLLPPLPCKYSIVYYGYVFYYFNITAEICLLFEFVTVKSMRVRIWPVGCYWRWGR